MGPVRRPASSKGDPIRQLGPLLLRIGISHQNRLQALQGRRLLARTRTAASARTCRSSTNGMAAEPCGERESLELLRLWRCPIIRPGTLSCRHCYRAQYGSQKCDKTGRRRLAAAKLRLGLGGLPSTTEPIPSKPKWTRRRTYQRIRNEIQALEAKAKAQRFKKPLSSQLFAYHVG
jgi:hypothetical protein